MSKAPSPVQRRLAALFCADVAGYSRLMNSDEVGTLRLLTAHREMTDRLIPLHGGRIANTAGDSILAEFPSAVDALQCALGIHERIAAMHEEVPEEQRVSFRIGVHVGEAMVRDGDLFGDGVNIAARMQSLAQPATVCLSATAYEYVHKVLPLVFEDLGPQPVKNIDAPVRAYLVRPTAERLSRPLPPVHSRMDFYLARRFQRVCLGAQTEVARQEGLIPIDLPALASIVDAPGLKVSGLAGRLGVTVPTARRIVARLKERALVETAPTQPGGGVRVLISTEAGHEARRRIRGSILAAQDRVMAPLSNSEREMLRDLLTRVIKAGAVKELADDNG